MTRGRGPAFTLGTRAVLFEEPYMQRLFQINDDIHPDGERCVLIKRKGHRRNSDLRNLVTIQRRTYRTVARTRRRYHRISSWDKA